MLADTINLFRTKDLLWAWTGRTVRARYQQSVLGWLWAIVQPIATVAIFTIVFTRFVKVDTGDIPYVIFSYVAVVPWTFLAMGLTDMAMSLIQNMPLVTKVYFPREALPIAAMFARLMDFGIAFSLVVLLMVYYKMPIALEAWIYLPVILAIQLALVAGLGLACAALNVFYRDVQPLLTLAVQMWFYASPIIYPVTLVPESIRQYYYLNPMAGILETYRNILLYGEPPGAYLIPSAITSFLVLFFGYWLFKRLEFLFADIV